MLNPIMQAQFDFNLLGSNENPFLEDTSNWEQYEQHFDTLGIESEKQGQREVPEIPQFEGTWEALDKLTGVK